MSDTIPAFFYRMDADSDHSGFACSTSRPYSVADESVYWVPVDGGGVTVDDPETGDTVPTGVTLTADQVAERLIDERENA